jgi:3-oxoacyl-[acyl-carrier-protein] synthase-3
MNGKKLYKLSSKILPNFINNSLREINFNICDIDWIVPHQASQGSLNHIIKMLKLDKNKIIDIFHRNGNQVASSIPTVLSELLNNKPIKKGDKVLIIGTSAGIGLGMIVWEIP